MDELEQLKQRAAQAITAVYEKTLVEADREDPRPTPGVLGERLDEVATWAKTEATLGHAHAIIKARDWGLL